MTFDEILEQNRPDQDNYDNAVAMSQRFQKATESPDFVENPFLNLEDAAKASRNPVNRVYNENDLKNITSDVGTIAWDSFRKGVMDLQSVGDKAEMAIGNTLAGISGNTLGTEMRDRAADSLMKTMEESRFVDSNYGDAETWTSRFVGGGMSMAEMLAVGAATGGVGLGAYVGTLSLSDGALNDMVKYQEEHGNLDGYETDPKNLALDYLNAVFQIATEEVGGAGRLLNGRVFKAGKTGSAIAKETLINFLQESAQGAVSDLTEVLKGNQDISVLSENTIGYIKDGVVAGVLGGAIGGSAYKLNKNRALQNLDKINAVINPNATPAEIREKSEQVFEKTEEKMLKSFVPELMAQNEAINDKGAIRENVRTKIASMYEDADMSEQEKAQTIEATTSLELENMLYDSIERKIPLTANPLLQGEVNELGWFRNGIPEQRRQEIENLRKEYVNLRDELKAQNESAEKDYNKIDELETKLEVFRTELPNRLQDLIVADREQIRKMLAEQRESVANSQAKKRMISAIKRKAQSAIKAQEKADTKLAEQMARGAEKAQLQREKKETAQQTKEAKIRDLQEQRDIARAIKNVKVNIARKKAKESVVEPDYTEDTGYNSLKQQGYTDEQIAKMSAQQIEKAIAEQPTNVMQQEQFDLADENARLDDIYPEYTGETIEVDGKERTVYNSNGDRIAKSKEALTNFWRWFGDSKVVDEQGRPLVVYHGTSSKFDTFSIDESGKNTGTAIYGQGFYFTTDKEVATKWGAKRGEPIVMSVYVKLENPNMVKELEYPKDSKEKGFDGVIAKVWGGNELEIVAFEPTQIKSVNNRGTYSSDTGNIYFQFAGEKAQTAAQDKLSQAKELDAQGTDNETIRQQTGWFKGVDGKWRFEISDGKLKNDVDITKYRHTASDGEVYYVMKLHEIYDNEELYNAYPVLRNAMIQFQELPSGVSGITHPDSIALNISFLLKDNPKFIEEKNKLESTKEYKEYNESYTKEYADPVQGLKEMDSAQKRFFETEVGKQYKQLMWGKNSAIPHYIDGLNESTKSTLVHEIQHAIQQIENFASGGNLKTAQTDVIKNLYDAQIRNSISDKVGQNNVDSYLALIDERNALYKKSLDEDMDVDEFEQQDNALVQKMSNMGLPYNEYVEIIKESARKTGYGAVSTSKQASDVYTRLYGEVESRNVQARAEMTEEERKATPIESTQDVKNADAIVIFKSGVALSYTLPQKFTQGKVTGGKDTYRGAYLPEYRFIAKTENMDASTLNHELAHDWGQEYFRWARSGKASESFLRSWGAVEKAIGITDNDTYFTYDASEKFARAYEGWLLQKKDWAKILKIHNDDDKKAVESMMEDYRKQLVDIYESLVESSKYFKETFGEVGELKPELVDFFERATRYDDIELREKRGEITAEQANQEKLNHLVETAVNGQVENMPVEQAQEADAIGQIQDLQETANDTERFETEGGNVKSLQRRLDRIALAQDLTQNDKDLGKYDSHRDMLAVAEQADEFVQNRRDDALAIINGEMAEQDGLYASDLYTALERVANSTGDFDLIQELRNSKIANEMAKELGQRIAGFRNYKGSGDVDVVSVLNSLDKQLKTEYNKNKSTADEYIGDLVAELKSVDNNAQLDAFFDEMECR